ncbi:MAG TPA: hypothetical protein VGO17_08790 [Aurantimonas sp.]|jgi:hypothetical protein|nr:hypothetical protein [Aurantimonas sp.]
MRRFAPPARWARTCHSLGDTVPVVFGFYDGLLLGTLRVLGIV